MKDSNLVLDSLEVKGYRAFRSLRIPSLARVNLVTGKNSVGKSCLLEALWLYANRAEPSTIRRILDLRDEQESPVSTNGVRPAERDYTVIRNLFSGRPAIEEFIGPIVIGPVNTPDKMLSLTVGWSHTLMRQIGQPFVFSVLPEANADDYPRLIMVSKYGLNEQTVQLVSWFFQGRAVLPVGSLVLDSFLVSASGIDRKEMGQLWDLVSLTDAEQDVQRSLHLINPDVRKVALTGDPETQRGRIPMARIERIADPVPLRSLGEGMNRVFGVVLALVNSTNGLLLIDEVDSGLHYSVQPDLWRLIFEVARRLNVQVFATTHSWDCVEGFQQASREDGESEGLLIRLDRKGEDIVPTVFEENELAIATRSNIEVR